MQNHAHGMHCMSLCIAICRTHALFMSTFPKNVYHCVYLYMWQYLWKGPISGQCKHMGARQNSRETANSRNRRLLHHWKILCIPYLPAKFEIYTAFLRLKRGPNNFTASGRPQIIIRRRPDFNYIHGHYASLVVFRRKLPTASETTSAPLYNLHNHWIVSQRMIFIAATSVDFPDVERNTND